jgi:tryptophan synthase alpha chain
MSRIDEIFRRHRAENRGALMPFLTAGYPSPEATAAVLPALQRAGAGICELGFPFSDPIADGPVIQESMTAALGHGVQPDGVFELVRSVRDELDLGLIAMVSYSIVYRMGVERFVERSADAGFDGFIFPDLPVEEAEAVTGPVREAGLSCSLLIAPTTPIERAEAVAQASSGFVYVLARAGITGARDELTPDVADRVRRLREVTDLPIAVGFGIARPEHVAAVTEVADAAIVGSALVRELGNHPDASPQELAGHVERFVAELSGGLRGRG